MNIELPPRLHAFMPSCLRQINRQINRQVHLPKVGKPAVKLSNKACPPLAWNDEI